MKKLFLISVAVLISFTVQSQVCITRYQGDDFGMSNRFNSISDIEMDRLGNIWFVTTPPPGIFGQVSQIGKFDGDSGWAGFVNDFQEVNTFYDIALDKEDSVWIAMYDGLGILNIHTLEGRILTPDNSNLPDKHVTAVAVDSNNVKWIGLNTGVIAEFNPDTIILHEEWGKTSVKLIEIASDGSVWAGLGTLGIVRYKDGKWISYPELKNVKAITADKWGRILIASADSMIIYHDGITGVVNAETTILGIEVGPMGRIWASTSYGLLLKSGDRFVQYSNTNSALPSMFSGPVKFDSDNKLWFGYKYQSGEWLTATGYLYRPDVQETPVITTDNSSLIFCYGDSLTLSAQEDQVSYVWPDGSNADTYKVYDADDVEVAVESNDQCFYYDTVKVNVQKVYEEEKVCAVSVDTSQENIIIWEKTPEVGTHKYHIYREMAAADSFEFIGEVPVGELSVFVDPDVDPRERSVKYKISSVDTCGNESGPSFYHRTLHLTINKGAQDGWVNLIWTPYEGLNFPTYYIYRGSSPDNMVKYDSIASGNTTWTDVNAFDTLYYVLAVPISDACRPSENKKKGTGPYYHSLSNMDDNKKVFSHIGNLNAAIEIRSYPNPFSELTRIEYPDPNGMEYQLRIYNLSGKMVREIIGITGGEVFFERENLAAGYYVFELKGEKQYRGKFVIR